MWNTIIIDSGKMIHISVFVDYFEYHRAIDSKNADKTRNALVREKRQ